MQPALGALSSKKSDIVEDPPDYYIDNAGAQPLPPFWRNYLVCMGASMVKQDSAKAVSREYWRVPREGRKEGGG